MDILINFIRAVYPFFKEVFLGQATFSQAWKKDKRRVLALFIVLGSILLNVFAIPRLFELSYEQVQLKRELSEVKIANLTPPKVTCEDPFDLLRTDSLQDATPVSSVDSKTIEFDRYDFLKNNIP